MTDRLCRQACSAQPQNEDDACVADEEPEEDEEPSDEDMDDTSEAEALSAELEDNGESDEEVALTPHPTASKCTLFVRLNDPI